MTLNVFIQSVQISCSSEWATLVPIENTRRKNNPRVYTVVRFSLKYRVKYKKRSIIFLFHEIFCLSRKIEQKLGQNYGLPLKSLDRYKKSIY